MKKNVGPDLFDDEIALRVKNDAVNQLNNKVGEIKVVCETLLEALDSTNAKTVFKDSVTFYQNYIRKGKQIELKSSLFETFELFDLIFSNPKKARDIFSNASFRELYTLVSDSLFLSIVNMFKHELNIKKLPVESYIPNEQSKTDIENIETNEKNANFIKNELHTSNLSQVIKDKITTASIGKVGDDSKKYFSNNKKYYEITESDTHHKYSYGRELNTNNLTLINQERNGKIEHILNYNANDVGKVIRGKKGNYIILKNSKGFTIVNDLNKETICEDLVFRGNPDLFMDIKLVTIKGHECIIFTNGDRKLLINPLNNNHIDLFEDQYFITLNTIFINDEYKHTINTNEGLITIVKLRTFHQYTAVINNDGVLSIYDNTTKEHLRTIEGNIEDFEYLKDTDIKCIINKQLEYTKDGERNYTV